jgi:hypothetical protein
MWLEWQRAILDETMASARRLSHLPSIWERAQSLRKGVSPSEVAYEQDRLKVLHYLSSEGPCYGTPLLFVYALLNRPYILDLKAGRSVVSHFIKSGFDTYLVDWGVPTRADRHLTLDDYINGYLPDVVEHLCERTGSPQVSILGYCMGGTMSAMFTASISPRSRTWSCWLHPSTSQPKMACSTCGANRSFSMWTGLWTPSEIVPRSFSRRHFCCSNRDHLPGAQHYGPRR